MGPQVFKRAPPPPPTIQRFAVRSPAEANAPRARRELNALRALGAVLDQRAWWAKWTKRPAVQREWLREIERALVRANVAQVLAVWPRDGALGETHALRQRARALAAQTNQRKKKSGIEELLVHVLFPALPDEDAFNEGGRDEDEDEDEDDDSEDESDDDEADEGEDDSEDETALDEDGNAVSFDAAVQQAKKTHGIGEDEAQDVVMDDDAEDEDEDDDAEDALDAHKDKDPFGQIAWFVTMCAVREQLLALAPGDWTDAAVSTIIDAASERASEQVVERACSLILAVVGGEATCSLETVKAHVPEETREHVLRILLLHFNAIREVLETTKDDLTRVLDVVVKRLALPAKDEMEGVAASPALRTPGPVPHSWMSDNTVPAELKAAFLKEIAALGAAQEGEQDVVDQVLHLIDPSLCCGVVGQTARLPPSAAKRVYGSAAEHFRAVLFAPAKSKLAGPKNKSSKFQWLPCEVDVDEQEEGGNASILTYINNLHPETHGGLYRSIEQIFTRFVPLFETVLSSLDDQAQNRAVKALYDFNDAATLPCAPSLVPPGLFETSKPQLALKGTRCQVIVKVAEIQLTPKRPSYTGDVWHIEGSEAERIIATGVYYYGSDNVSESKLAFRTFVATPEDEQGDSVGVGLTYGVHSQELPVQYTGGVTALEDRCVVLPNIYQNKLEPLALVDPTKPGSCKMLTFFLVDPTDAPIPSTAVVPPQQQAWIDLASEPQMKRLRLTDRTQTTSTPLEDTTREGLALEQAKASRLELTRERRSPADEAGCDVADGFFSLTAC